MSALDYILLLVGLFAAGLIWPWVWIAAVPIALIGFLLLGRRPVDPA